MKLFMLVGICLLVTAITVRFISQDQTIEDTDANQFLNYLSETQNHVLSQNKGIEYLQRKTQSNIESTQDVISELKSASAVKSELEKAKKGILSSVKTLTSNVEWTNSVDSYFVADPYKLDLALSQCHEYMNKASLEHNVNHVHTYVKVWNEIQANVRQLSSLMKDLITFISDTQKGSNKIIKELSLRQTYSKSGKLTPNRDVEIWHQVLEDAIKNLEHQISQMKTLNIKLAKLQKASARTQDDLENMVKLVRVNLKSSWFSNDFKSKFDFLVSHSRIIVQHSTDTLDNSKTISTTLEQSHYELQNDFTLEEITDQLGDEDFANDFQEQLMDLLKRLDSTTSGIHQKLTVTQATYKLVIMHFDNASNSKDFKTRVVGHPISSEISKYGNDVLCDSNAVVTEQCGAGEKMDCNGASTYGRCERFQGLSRQGYWMNQSNWGQYTECKSGAVSGMCTSGGKKDCRGYAHRIYCNTRMQTDRRHCQYIVQPNYGEIIQCPQGYVVIGRAASGKHKDAKYNGHQYSTYMKCCKATTPTLYEQKRAITPVKKTTLVAGHNINSGKHYGVDVLCQSNAIVTQQCGGGEKFDCNGGSTNGWCERFTGVSRRGYWQSERDWGKYSECKSGAVSGMCTSGGKQDCGGYAHKIFCNTEMQTDRKYCSVVTQYDYHKTIACPHGYVVVGRAASGKHKDAKYHGRGYTTWMKCCKAISPRLYK